MKTGIFLLFCIVAALSGWCAESFAPKPVPRMQAIPLPHYKISFERDGQELTRYHFDPADKRSFLFPINGPSGRSLTRLGHPHDPVTHSHHNSLWVSHQDVDGVSFWDDRGKGRIVTKQIERYDDLGETSAIVATNAWVDEGHAGRTILNETR